MGLELWFKDDIGNILLSLSLSSATTGRWIQDTRLDAYRCGYEEALMAVALAFGLPPRSVMGAGREQNCNWNVTGPSELLP